MAKYRYAGRGPAQDEDGEAVHPGDVREFDQEPGWGPWELVPGDERQSAAGPAPVNAGASDGQPSVPPQAAQAPTTAAPAAPEGM